MAKQKVEYVLDAFMERLNKLEDRPLDGQFEEYKDVLSLLYKLVSDETELNDNFIDNLQEEDLSRFENFIWGYIKNSGSSNTGVLEEIVNICGLKEIFTYFKIKSPCVMDQDFF